MTSPHNRAAVDRVGQRAAGRRRIAGATAMTAAGGAALAIAFGTVFAQGAAADTAAKSPQPAASDDWAAPAALQAPAPAPAAAQPSATPKKKAAATPSPTPPPAAPVAAPEDSVPAASTGAS